MSSKRKKMLILRVSSDACDVEVAQLETIADMHDIDPKLIEVDSDEDLRDAVSGSTQYDYIYVAAHGDAHGIEGDNGYSVDWVQFAYLVCREEALAQNCVFLLACCRGGMVQVAMDIFIGCEFIEYVFGPRWLMTAPDITTAFHVFIYNMEYRRMQPDQAAKMATKATGYDFLSYDRVEVEYRYDFGARVEELQERFEELEAQFGPLN